jgi:hypothetical protein
MCTLSSVRLRLCTGSAMVTIKGGSSYFNNRHRPARPVAARGRHSYTLRADSHPLVVAIIVVDPHHPGAIRWGNRMVVERPTSAEKTAAIVSNAVRRVCRCTFPGARGTRGRPPAERSRRRGPPRLTRPQAVSSDANISSRGAAPSERGVTRRASVISGCAVSCRCPEGRRQDIPSEALGHHRAARHYQSSPR